MRFSLIRQLFLLSLCTLLLPWAGCQYVREMETLIRLQQSQYLAAQTQPLAQLISQHSQQILPLNPSNEPSRGILFAPFSTIPVVVDGYDDDWVIYHQQNITNVDARFQLRSKADEEFLYLFVIVDDKAIDYYNPTQDLRQNYDGLQLNNGQDQFRVFTEAPGNSQVIKWQPPAEDEDWIEDEYLDNDTQTPFLSIHANWQENTNGYQVELKIPLRLLNEGLTVGTLNPDTKTAPMSVISSSVALAQLVKPFQQTGSQIQVVDAQGWPLLPQPDGDQLNNRSKLITRDNMGRLLLNWLYRVFLDSTLPSRFAAQWPLGDDNPSGARQRLVIEKLLPPAPQAQRVQQWYALAESHQSLLLVMEPIYHHQQTIGYVINSQMEDALLSFTNKALRRVMNLSLLTFMIIVSVLMGYAFWLSMRIKRLRVATQKATTTDGRIELFIADNFADELGALSHDYRQLLERVKNYNDYLQSLTHKLAHEIRTPLAIVKSSLEMLAQVNISGEQSHHEQRKYIERALQGNERLAKMLNAMSESTQVEQFVQQAEFSSLSLTALLEELYQAYQTTYPTYQFSLLLPETACTICGNPELMAQLLDKLIDNARDFSKPGSNIHLSLKQYPDYCHLEVFNPDSSLPENMQEQLFDSLISIRQGKTQANKPHLGLGLYIVRLIASAHHGEASATNAKYEGCHGVRFRIKLPLVDNK